MDITNHTQKIYENLKRMNKWISACNNEKKYTEIERVLILLCYEDIIVYSKEDDFVKHFFLLSYLFRNIHVDFVIKQGFIRLCDNNEFLNQENQQIIHFEDVNLLNYDLIVCSHSYIAPLSTRLLISEESPFIKQLKSTALYSLDSGISNSFGKISELILNPNRRFIISTEEKKEANAFVREVMSKYVSVRREDQEKKLVPLIKSISSKNIELKEKLFKKILILDDSTPDFYIGDTCKWLYSLKIQILEKFPSAQITINWQNKEKYVLAFPIVLHTLEKRIKFQSNDLNNIFFGEFDCILCHESIAGIYLMFADANKMFLKNTSIYYYKSDPFEESEQPSIYHWNLQHYQRLKESNDLPVLSLKSIKRVRSYKFSELIVTKEERKWGDWLLSKHGICIQDKVIILPDNASHILKCLNRHEYIKLIISLMSDCDVKIVLFDEQNIGKKNKLVIDLNEEQSKRLIVIDGTTIRQTMCILASSYVKAIIGPCTGILHLANGIYSHYLQKDIIRKEDVPVLLVYVGKQQPKYSAWGWWGRTMVDCVVHRLDQYGCNKLVPLASCPKEYYRFQNNLLSANEIKAEQLMRHLLLNYSLKLFSPKKEDL